MSSKGFIPKPLSATELKALVLDALQNAPDDHNPETYHALFDHLERGLSTDDVIHALETGWTIASCRFNEDEWQYKYEIEGEAIDGGEISIVLAVDTLRREFMVITRWRNA